MVFGHDTAASFLRDSNEVTVLLGQGNVSIFHDADGTPVRMKVGEVSIVPVSGFKTLGEVAMLNGAVVVTAKDGMLRVTEGNGQVVNVAKGKTISVTPRAKAPQGGGGSAGRCCGGSNVWDIAATVAGGTAAVLAGLALSRASDAKDNSASAATAAAAAASAAAQAAAAAAAANSAAINASNCAADVFSHQISPSAPPPFPCTT
jgi:hypothetical protein